jgi:shikimate dehydrogenase
MKHLMNETCPKAFIVGHPVAHSRSPLIHGYWLRHYSLAGSYERLTVTQEDFSAFITSLKESGFAGGNVTLPHKETAFRLCGQVTDRANRIGAVNTLWFEGDMLWGDNTDSLGFGAHCDACFGRDWTKTVTTALVLGAGGAARAIIASLLDQGLSDILIANRTRERAQNLINLSPALSLIDWEDVPHELERVQCLVNTTALGMSGKPPLVLDLSPMCSGYVSDIVYAPLETPLLRQAKTQGLAVADGLGMLLHQAAPGFARWFGTFPAVTRELRTLIETDLAREA